MIECVEEKIYYKKNNRRKKNKTFKIIVFLSVILLSGFYYKKVITVNVANVCADKCSVINSKSVNGAILASLQDSVIYDNLVKIEKNSSGEIILISANSYEINKLGRKITDISQKSLEENLKEGINLPLLVFTGLPLLSGMGPEIIYDTIMLSSVNCDFISNFTSVGINQTLHSVYAEIKSEITIDFPLDNRKKTYSTRVLLCEAVLVGKVPEIYLSNGLFNKI